MSITAGCVACIVVLVRQLLRRAPKKYSYLLWLVVAFRLVCPFSLNSDISIFNLSAFRFVNLQQYDIQGNETDSTAGTYTDGKNSVSDMKNYAGAASNVSDNKASGNVGYNSNMSGESVSDKSGTQNSYSNQSNTDLYTSNTMLNVISDKDVSNKNESGRNVSYAKSQRAVLLKGDMLTILTFIWLAGVLVMAVYGIISYIILDRRIAKALKIDDNVYRSNRINTPFVMGFVHPRIYIPCFLDNASMRYVTAHEKCHIARRDYIIKAVSFVLLCIHWFNPLIWAAFFLMGKDMEMSCDELVVEKMLRAEKNGFRDILKINKDYSYALLCCASSGRFPAPGPLCFGDISVKGRIKNVLNYKKPRKFMTAAAILLCMVVLAACSANPKSTVGVGNTPQEEESSEQSIETVPSTEDASKQPESYAADKNVTGDDVLKNSSEDNKETYIVIDTGNLDDTIFDACVTYHMNPQEVKDLIDNASDEEKISIYTQCRMYSEDELDEWAEKMAAYYGDGWHTRMSGDSIVNIVSTGTTWYKYELAGYDADIEPDLDLKPVYSVPVDDAKITAGYGYIKSESGSGFHFEDDFSVEQGSDVKAVADGKVLLAGWEGSHGISVVTQNDDGYMTSYYHLSTADVNVGDRVAAGDVIGQTGQSGDATCPMLSFAVSYYDEETGINFIEPAYQESPYTELDIEYTKNPDGTYSYDGNTYEYKLQVAGYERNAHVTYIVLTNDLDTDFDAVVYRLIGSQAYTGVPEFVIIGWYY